MDADAFCKAAHAAPVYAQEVVVNSNGTLQHVIVYVKEGVSGSYPPPRQAVLLDQKGCQYYPHVFGIQTGQPLTIKNSDGTLHNIHALPTKNAEFNIGQPFQGMETVKKFDQPEVGLQVQVRRPQVDGRLRGRPEPPLLRDDRRSGDFRDQEPPAGHLRRRGLAREVRSEDAERDGLRDASRRQWISLSEGSVLLRVFRAALFSLRGAPAARGRVGDPVLADAAGERLDVTADRSTASSG